jgi:hypothetical protein
MTLIFNKKSKTQKTTTTKNSQVPEAHACDPSYSGGRG